MNYFANLWHSIFNNLSVALAAIFGLALILVTLKYFRLRNSIKSNENTATTMLLGRKWLESLEEAEFEKYLFLAWFPLNHTLHTETYRKRGAYIEPGDFSFESVPTISTLLKRKVIKIRDKSLSEFVLEIDQSCYDAIEKYTNEVSQNATEEEKKEYAQVLRQIQNSTFASHFPKARQR